MMSWFDDIEVMLAETQPMNILYLRKMMSSNDYALGYEKYFSRLYERIAVDKLTLLGTPMTIYHSPEYNPAGLNDQLQWNNRYPQSLLSGCKTSLSASVAFNTIDFEQLIKKHPLVLTSGC